MSDENDNPDAPPVPIEPVISGARKFPGRKGRPPNAIKFPNAMVVSGKKKRHVDAIGEVETFATQKRRLAVPDWKRFSRMLSTATDRGKVLVEFAMEVLGGVGPDGERYDMKHRMDALKFIAERMYGRVKGEVEISGPKGGPIPIVTTNIDLSKCSDEELAALDKVFIRATVDVIDAEYSESESESGDGSSENQG